MYDDNLNVDKLLNWVNAMVKYFDYEYVEDDQKVKYAVTRLKGHATL